MTIPSIKLPAVTFFCGGSQSLRTETAHVLADNTYNAQTWSFSAPIQEATLGCFFSGDPGIDVGKLSDRSIFPEGGPTFGDFVSAFSQFLPAFFSSPAIIGRLALRRLEENRQYFHHFIFDDADTKENIKLVADLFGRSDSLIVNFGEPYLLSKSIRVLDLPRSLPHNPSSVINYLAHSLTPAQTVASPMSSAPSKDPLDDLL